MSVAGMDHVSQVIDGIFALLLQAADEIEELKERVAALEAQSIPDPPQDGRRYWYDYDHREWVAYKPRI